MEYKQWMTCQFLQQLIYSRMNIELNDHLSNYMSALVSNKSFSESLKQFSPLLIHLSRTQNEMILSQYLYSLVNYSNQISLKYFALVDYLLQAFPSFTTALESIIEPIFVKTFVWLHHNGRVGDCEQMKSFRTRWSARFNPHTLYNIKLGIWNWIHVDIDLNPNYNGYRQQAFQPRDSNINPIDTFQKRRIEDPRQLPVQKKRFVEGKRETDSTQESTNVVPSKVQEKLARLNDMAPHRCKLCGMRFSSKNNLDLHQKEQMKENIKSYKEKKIEQASKSSHIIVRSQGLDTIKWVDPNPVEVKEQEFFYYLKDFQYESTSCSFCCQNFEMKELKESEEWAYTNCCQVLLNGRDCAMHKTCFDILNQEDACHKN